MALVLTRKPGEAVILRRRGPDGELVQARLYVISIEGNTVRLAFDMRPEVEIIREELLVRRDGLALVIPLLFSFLGP